MSNYENESEWTDYTWNGLCVDGAVTVEFDGEVAQPEVDEQGFWSVEFDASHIDEISLHAVSATCTLGYAAYEGYTNVLEYQTSYVTFFDGELRVIELDAAEYAPGTTVNFTMRGFEPGAEVYGYVQFQPDLLGVPGDDVDWEDIIDEDWDGEWPESVEIGPFTADADGVVTGSYELPANADLGVYSISLSGEGPNDTWHNAYEYFTVVESIDDEDGNGDGSDGDKLPDTGSTVNAGALGLGAAALLALGGGALLLGRRMNAAE